LDTTFRVLVLLLIAGGVVFFIFAWAKGWLKSAGGRGSFTSQVIMHDWLNKNNEALEYVIDEEEEEEKKDALWGEDKEPGYEEKGGKETTIAIFK